MQEFKMKQDEQIQEMIRQIRNNEPGVKKIDFVESRLLLNKNQFEALIAAIKTNTHLIELRFLCTYDRPDGALLAEALEKNKTLKKLETYVGYNGENQVLKMLEKNKSLVHLKLFLKVPGLNYCVESDCNDPDFKEEYEDKIHDFLVRNRKLPYLSGSQNSQAKFPVALLNDNPAIAKIPVESSARFFSDNANIRLST